jgi:hypothetical protein
VVDRDGTSKRYFFEMGGAEVRKKMYNQGNIVAEATLNAKCS